jgi:hypothetical protein
MLFNQSVNLITVCPVHFLYDRISALAYDPVQNANGEHVKPSARVRWLLLFQVTTEFLQQLGITSMQDLPDFQKLVENIKLPETPGLNAESQAQAI